MKRRNLVLLIIMVLAAGSGIYFREWVVYLVHLGRHQAGAVFGGREISGDWIQKVSDEKKRASLELILRAHEFGKKIYGLEKSRSFSRFVELDRKVLGWNLTIAGEFSLEAKQFGFPVVGSFGYLGFFDPDLKDSWKKNFEAQRYDVCENEIGAYSTLGYFNDPVFSTYLDFEPVQLARLVLHEMAHEKYYMKNDSDFSESLASFIERPAANMLLYGTAATPVEIVKQNQEARAEFNKYQDMLDDTRTKLEELYKMKISEDEMRNEKSYILHKLFRNLKNTNFKYLKKLREFSREELNNAFLVQNRRYTPVRESGFKRLFADCKSDFKCWFEKVRELENCSAEVRKNFAASDMSMSDALKNCK